MSKVHKTKAGVELPIMALRGKDYLEVKYRLVWFREEHPNWPIETELLQTDKDSTLAKATIKNEAGLILSTSHKYEDKAGFADHKEKAETGAIGRALALLGYGTQFCADELDEGDRIVDAPAVTKSRPVNRPLAVAKAAIETVENDPGEYMASFGKFKGQKIKNIDQFELASYVSYIENASVKDGKEIKGQVLDFMLNAERFLSAREFGKDNGEEFPT